MNGTTDSCECVEGLEWNQLEIACKAKQFDYLLASIVGSGIVCKIFVIFSRGRIGEFSFRGGKKENGTFVAFEPSSPRAKFLSIKLTSINKYLSISYI